MADKPSLVHVEIFGQSYSVKAGADPGYVEKLAALVDARMQEVSRSSGAVDSVRIAVLAALNIADELYQSKSQSSEAEDKARARAVEAVRSRAEALARELDAVLAD
jgi:cell division protein ZapA